MSSFFRLWGWRREGDRVQMSVSTKPRRVLLEFRDRTVRLDLTGLEAHAFLRHLPAALVRMDLRQDVPTFRVDLSGGAGRGPARDC